MNLLYVICLTSHQLLSQKCSVFLYGNFGHISDISSRIFSKNIVSYWNYLFIGSRISLKLAWALLGTAKPQLVIVIIVGLLGPCLMLKSKVWTKADPWNAFWPPNFWKGSEIKKLIPSTNRCQNCDIVIRN